MSSAAASETLKFGWISNYEPITNDSRKIQKAWEREQNYLRGSASDWIPLVESALCDIREDCSMANWDGQGALSISEDTNSRVAKIANVLFRLLPQGTPAPDIFAEADGEIGMTWEIDAYRLFSLSVGEHDNINFAGQFHNDGGIHGWQPLDTTSYQSLEQSLQEVCSHIKRLYLQPLA